LGEYIFYFQKLENRKQREMNHPDLAVEEKKQHIRQILAWACPAMDYNRGICVMVSKLLHYRMQLLRMEQPENTIVTVECPLEELETNLFEWQTIRCRRIKPKEEAKMTPFDREVKALGLATTNIISVRIKDGQKLLPGCWCNTTQFRHSTRFKTFAENLPGFVPRIIGPMPDSN